MNVPALELTPVGPQDEAFLYELYASTRAHEVQQWGWSEAQAEAFLAQQFASRQLSLRQHHDARHDRIVRLDGKPIGRLWLDHDHSYGVDIAFLPEYRGRGFGAALLRQWMDDSARQGKPVRFSVQRGNPAQRLYARLGFEVVAVGDLYLQMAWSAAPEGGGDEVAAQAAEAVGSSLSTGHSHVAH